MNDNRREDERAPIALFATVRVTRTIPADEEGEEPQEETVELGCRATDVSVGGIRLEIEDADMQSGDAIEVEFELPYSDRTISATGEVRHVTSEHVGVEFDKLRKSVRKAIQRFVDEG